MIDSAETDHKKPPSLQENAVSLQDEANSCTQAVSCVIYVRVTPDELAQLKATANASKLSVQRHARITLGLKDRGGYRNRKERLNGQATIKTKLQSASRNDTPSATQAEVQTSAAAIAKGHPESTVPAGDTQRLPLSWLPQ